MMREKLEALADRMDGGWMTYASAGEELRAILAAEPDPALREAVAHMLFEMDTGNIGGPWEGENEHQQRYWREKADRICALFERAGGLRDKWVCDKCGKVLGVDSHAAVLCDGEYTRAFPPPADPGLRAEDLCRLAIYSVATCDINGGNKRDCPAILLEQAIAALSRTPPQNPPCPYYCEPSHVVGEKCACPCHDQKPQGDVQHTPPQKPAETQWVCKGKCTEELYEYEDLFAGLCPECGGPVERTPQCTCGAKKGEWHKQECAVNTPPLAGNGPAQDGRPFEAEDFKEELGRWKQHRWFWEVIDDLLSERTPQKPNELWVCSECGKEFDHRPGPHRIKYGGPLCDGTAVEKESEK